MQQIIRISEGFAPLHEEILARLGITAAKRLGLEYWLFSSEEMLDLTREEAGLFVRWQMRIDQTDQTRSQKLVVHRSRRSRAKMCHPLHHRRERRLGINPKEYLTDVLTRLPSMLAKDAPELTPAQWQKERSRKPQNNQVA